MGSLNTHNMHTLCGTVLRTSSPRIRNYTDNDGETGTGGNFRLAHAASRHIHTAQLITQEHKLQDSSKVPSDQFNVQFRLQHGSPTHGHIPAADAHHFIFFQVQPANQQSTITSANLCHKNVGRPWFTEIIVTRFQPFVSVHNARFHPEGYTNDNGSNQSYQNNIITPSNIQYLKLHVCN